MSHNVILSLPASHHLSITHYVSFGICDAPVVAISIPMRAIRLGFMELEGAY